MKRLFDLKFNFILALLLVLINIQGVCQNKYDNIDSLLSNCKGDNRDFQVVKLLHQAALESMNYDPLLTLHYIDTAMYISKKMNNDSCVAFSYYLYGRVDGQQTRFLEAAKNYFKALEYKEFMNDTIIGNIYCYLGTCYRGTQNIDVARKYFNKAKKIYDSLDYFIGLGDIYIIKGNEYLPVQKDSISLKYYLKALAYFKKSSFNKGIALAYNNIGVAYNNIGVAYNNMNYYDYAFENFFKSLKYAEKSNNFYAIYLAKMNLGNTCLNTGKRQEGYTYIENAKKECISNGGIERILRCTNFLAISYAEEEKYEKAFENMNLHIAYNDSFYSTKNKSKMLQLNFMEEYEKKRRKYKIQLIQNEKKAKTQRIIIVWSTFLAILISFFFYYTIRNKIRLQRSRKKLLSIKLEREELTRKSNETELKFKNGELEKLALHIIQKNEFIQKIKDKIQNVKAGFIMPENKEELDKINGYVNQSMNLDEERKIFAFYLDKYNQDFLFKLLNKYPNLTEMEKRLVVLLRLNFSTKEIAALFNVTSKSVDNYRFNLRKKFDINTNQSFSEYLSSIE